MGVARVGVLLSFLISRTACTKSSNARSRISVPIMDMAWTGVGVSRPVAMQRLACKGCKFVPSKVAVLGGISSETPGVFSY